jgi:hypothetical protein
VGSNTRLFIVAIFHYLVCVGQVSLEWFCKDCGHCSGSIGALFYIAAGFQSPNSTNTASTSPSPAVAHVSPNAATPTPVPTATPAPKPAHAHFGDGTQVVGKDVQPGTYRTRSAPLGCYFERLSGFGGTLGETLANENTDAPAIVTITPTDKGFKSQRCGTWTADLSAITKSQTTFDDGTYIVGTDFQPGTYRSSGQTGCYYARLAGFTGSLSDTLANENTDTPAVVTIAASDKGFEAVRCGTWTKQSWSRFSL